MLKVLIADDEPKVCSLIKNVIDWDALQLTVVGTAQDGLTALQIIETEQPDIVITDIRMPGMDGMELIEKSKELNNEISFIIISGHREFDYARNAIRFGVEEYLLKPLDENELTGILKRMVEKKENQELVNMKNKVDQKKIRHAIMEYLILEPDKFPGHFTLDEINQEYYCRFEPGLFQVLLIKADIRYDSGQKAAYQLLLNQISHLAEQELADSIELLTLTSMEGVYILINMDEEYETGLRKRLKRIRRDICALRDIYWEIEATIGTGIVTSAFHSLKESAAGARSAVLNRIFLGTGHTIGVIGRSGNDQSKPVYFNYQTKSELQERIELLDKKEITIILDGIRRDVEKSADIDGEQLLSLCEDLFELLIVGIKKIQSGFSGEQYKDEFRERFYMCTSLETVFQVLQASFDKVLEEIIDATERTIIKPIRSALKYVQDHYYEPLKLEDISRIVGFNPNYFSTMFKKETGKNFLEYLTQVRINQAKQLLIEGKSGIAEVSEDVGYSDLKYFSKLFKKETGLSPSEFRKLYQRLD